MISDEMVGAALAAYLGEKFELVRGSPSSLPFRQMRLALEAAEKAAWRPIAEIPNDEMLMVLAKNDTGMQMVWRASMLHRQHHHKTPRHLDFGATKFRAIGQFDAPLSSPLPRSLPHE